MIAVNNFSRMENRKLFQQYDVIWIDDPQPLGMIPMIKVIHPEIPLLWRCHVHADPEPSIRTYLSEVLEGVFNVDTHKIIHKFMLEKFNLDMTKLVKEKLRVNGAIFHLKEFAKGLKLSNEVPVFIMGPVFYL
ncbi:hypothetical protein MHBO_001907 [Bonamia ostreae]|uniref:Trehalose synthase N-terminal domain-containing protein n=1 Tax=Bonamia ostreae TaxID=126728 RepID=A0ABV2AKJ8_9EUKA